jgi:hypothetical protein
LIDAWEIFNLNCRFHESHILAWRMGIEAESNHQVSRCTNEIEVVVFLSMRTIRSLRTIVRMMQSERMSTLVIENSNEDESE